MDGSIVVKKGKVIEQCRIATLGRRRSSIPTRR
jgi:hypothetical protein